MNPSAKVLAAGQPSWWQRDVSRSYLDRALVSINDSGVASDDGDAQALRRAVATLALCFARLQPAAPSPSLFRDGLHRPVARRWLTRRLRARGQRELELEEECESGADLAAVRDFLHALFDFPGRRLAVYGTLAPGRTNFHRLGPLGGSWSTGRVSGRLSREGWGSQQGYPGMRWEASAQSRVQVEVLRSRKLQGAWQGLDAFEGPDYRRVWAPVDTPGGVSICNLYALR